MDGPTSALETLAAALGTDAYAITLTRGDRPHLTVTNRLVPRLSESVREHDGWFWWGWAERIAPIGEIGRAVHTVTAVLGVAEHSRG